MHIERKPPRRLGLPADQHQITFSELSPLQRSCGARIQQRNQMQTRIVFQVDVGT
jgi:hypothetical protein